MSFVNNYSKGSIRWSLSAAFGLLAVVAVSDPALAIGAAITSIATTITTGTSTTVSGSPGSSASIIYQGGSKKITSFQSGGNNWNIVGGGSAQFVLQRNTINPTVELVWELSSSPGTELGGVPTSTLNALSQNNIYLGTDNIFANTGNTSGNQSNIERVDYLLGQGFISTANVGFTVFERGTVTGHDGFKIAAITGFDAQNNPLYGNLLTVASGWGTTSLTNTTDDYDILRNNFSGNSNFGVSTRVNDQTIGGLLIKLSELATPGTAIYGYSLFASDVTSAFNLSNYLSFPTNTTESAGGGLDLVAANMGLVVIQGQTAVTAVPEPSVLPGLLLLGSCLTWVCVEPRK